MNNKRPNKYPNKKVNQIKDPSNVFGMNCIFESRNAKLHFCKNNRIALIFIIILIGNQIVILEIHL